jgi:hypothetical protein
VVRAEWTKLCASRSTWFTLGGSALLMIAIAGLIGYRMGRSIDGGDPAPTLSDATSAAFLPIDFFMLVVAVFGVVQMTGEYATGLIRTTLAAVPRPLTVLAAKALALAGLTVPVTAVASVLSFGICQAFIGDAGAGLGNPGVLRAIAGAAVGVAAVGLLGLGLGAVVRNTAGAVTTLVTGLLILPAMLPPALNQRLEDAIMPYVPLVAGQAMYVVVPSDDPFRTLSPAASGIVLLGWAAVLLAGGAVVLHRRDA